MYWPQNDDDEKRKLEREEKLRKKKGLPVVEETKPSTPEAPVSGEHLDRVLALLEQQMKVTAEQSKQLSDLNQSLEKQKELLKEALSREPIIKEGVKKTDGDKQASYNWDHVDVPILDTEGIEDAGTGKAGEKTVGKSINNRIEMLKKLKNKGKEE